MVSTIRVHAEDLSVLTSTKTSLLRAEPRTGAKKERHSELERIRRGDLRQAFDSLCDVVPDLQAIRHQNKITPQVSAVCMHGEREWGHTRRESGGKHMHG